MSVTGLHIGCIEKLNEQHSHFPEPSPTRPQWVRLPDVSSPPCTHTYKNKPWAFILTKQVSKSRRTYAVSRQAGRIIFCLMGEHEMIYAGEERFILHLEREFIYGMQRASCAVCEAHKSALSCKLQRLCVCVCVCATQAFSVTLNQTSALFCCC